MGQSDNETPRGGSLGRDAWLALGAGIALLGVLLGLSFPLEKFKSHDDATTCAFIGFVTFLGCALWSVVLGIRALCHGERQTSPMALLTLILCVGLGLLGIAGWFDGPEFLREWFLSVLLPLSAFVCLTAIPVLLFMLRRKRLKRIARGEPALTRRQRWRFVLTRGGIYALLCFMLFAPVLLYTQALFLDQESWITKNMPDFFRDGFEQVIHAGGISTRELEYRILKEGLASTARIQERLLDGNFDTVEWAEWHLAVNAKTQLADFGVKLEQGAVVHPKEAVLTRERYRRWVAAFGTTVQRREILAKIRKSGNAAEFQEALYATFFHAPDPGLRDEFEALQLGNATERAIAFFYFLDLEPAAGQRKFILNAFQGADGRFVETVLKRAAHRLGRTESTLLIHWEALNLRQLDLRASVLEEQSFNSRKELQHTIGEREFLMKLSEQLSAGDETLARLATAHLLMHFAFPKEKEALDTTEKRLWKAYWSHYITNHGSFRNLPENADEHAVSESLRKKIESILSKPESPK